MFHLPLTDLKYLGRKLHKRHLALLPIYDDSHQKIFQSLSSLGSFTIFSLKLIVRFKL